MNTFTKAAALALLVQCLATVPAHADGFAWQTRASLAMPRIWRGMDVIGNNEAVFNPSATLGYTLNRFDFGLDADGYAALWHRSTPFETALYDQARLRFLGQARKVAGCDLGAGLTLYRNFGVAFDKYAGVTAEPFARGSCLSRIGSLGFEIHFDRTPAQEGSYWAFLWQGSFGLAGHDVNYTASYGHAHRFLKQGSYEFFKRITNDTLYALQDVFPTDLQLELSSAFDQGPVALVPKVGLLITGSRFLNRSPVELYAAIQVVGGLTHTPPPGRPFH